LLDKIGPKEVLKILGEKDPTPTTEKTWTQRLKNTVGKKEVEKKGAELK
jgi:hypothetical protein